MLNEVILKGLKTETKGQISVMKEGDFQWGYS